jgi:tetratricopeptide (TPR) repeat protein
MTAPWLVPLPRPQSYVGRKDQLARLITHVHSEGCHRYAVYGLGGCGKTALALEAAYQMREQQPERAIFWVPAISLSAFEQAYREIGLLLRIPGITDTNADVKQLVRAKLSDEGFGQWLIIVDNADDDGVLFNLLTEGSGAARLIDYLPNSRKGSFIFTTRVAKAAHNLAGNNVIELGMLNKNEAKEVLRTRLFPKYQHQIEDEAAVDDFLGMLAFLALAIVQAAAFINQNDIQLFKYVQLYRASEQEATKLLSEEFQDQGRYRETKNPIATTWRISFEQIRERDRLAADHMSFMACTASNDIPESMLLVEESQVAQEKAIGVLKAYAFITEQELVGDEWQHQQEQTRISKRSFNVHPLVHLAIRGWLKAHNKWREWLETTMSRLELIVPLGDHETIREWTAYLPHAKHIVDMPEVYETEVRMGLLRRIGECEMMLGQYKAAEETLRLLVERKTHLFGEDDRRAMKYKENLAQTLLHQGRSAEAEQVARRMLKIRTQTLGEEHEVALISMNNVAVALSYQGQFAEAEQMHRRILVLRQKVLGKERPITLASMQNLAIALRKQDQHIEAEQILRETVELRKKVLGCEHPDTVKSTSSLARVLSALGRYEEAAQLCRETLVLRAKVLGEQHPRTQKSREHLAEVLENLGRYEEAVSIRNPRS